MLRRARVLALPLGFLLALAIAACGSGDKETGATLTPPPPETQASTQTTGTTTAATTVQTTTAPPSTTTATVPPPTTSTPSSGGATTTQPSGGAPAGCPNAVGGFVRDVRATDCGAAGSVANAWFAAVHGGARPDSTIAAAGYSCDATMSGERADVTCSGSGGGSVAFTASP